MTGFLQWVATVLSWWGCGFVLASPVCFLVARYSKGNLRDRQVKAAKRSLLWPFFIVALVLQVVSFVFMSGVNAGSALLCGLAMNAQDREQLRLDEASRALETATREADEAEDARDEMDKELARFEQEQRLATALGDDSPGLVEAVRLAEESEQGDFVESHELVTDLPETNPHGRVCYVEKTLAVRTTSCTIKQIDSLKDHSLLWKCEKTGYWYLVRNMTEVPAGWPMWQVDRGRSEHRLLEHTVGLRFYGYNTETGLPR